MYKIEINPECMDIICNIQNMREKTVENYNRLSDFKKLQGMSSDQLRSIQYSVLKDWNALFNNYIR